MISDPNGVCYDNMGYGKTLKRVGMCPPSIVFPTASSLWDFPEPLHLSTSLLQLLKGIDIVQKLTDS
jgi:hypothetical protein